MGKVIAVLFEHGLVLLHSRSRAVALEVLRPAWGRASVCSASVLVQQNWTIRQQHHKDVRSDQISGNSTTSSILRK